MELSEKMTAAAAVIALTQSRPSLWSTAHNRQSKRTNNSIESTFDPLRLYSLPGNMFPKRYVLYSPIYNHLLVKPIIVGLLLHR